MVDLILQQSPSKNGKVKKICEKLEKNTNFPQNNQNKQFGQKQNSYSAIIAKKKQYKKNFKKISDKFFKKK